MKRICVFCGSSPGRTASYASAAIELGTEMARRSFGLVYGGGRRGLMGKIARSVFDSGQEVIGVMPEALARKELAFDEVGELRIVRSMHERKAMMAELSDGFVALPGGFGTLEELFETVTWAQLGIHDKPVGLLDVGGYYDPLVKMIDRAVDEGFVKDEHRQLLIVDSSPGKLLDAMADWSPRPIDKVRWIVSMDET